MFFQFLVQFDDVSANLIGVVVSMVAISVAFIVAAGVAQVFGG